MNSYPHMCRMDHEEIGHRDSNNERCPLCRCIDERYAAICERNEVRVLAVLAVNQECAYRDGSNVFSPQGLYYGAEVERRIDCDGTDAGILDALRRAKEASDGH